MNVVFTRSAGADLDEIGDWIARDSPRRALDFVEELEDACRGLAANPLRFQLVPRHATSGVRRRVHGAYLIFYRAEPDRITILRILHGARDFEPLLFPDEQPD